MGCSKQTTRYFSRDQCTAKQEILKRTPCHHRIRSITPCQFVRYRASPGLWGANEGEAKKVAYRDNHQQGWICITSGGFEHPSSARLCSQKPLGTSLISNCRCRSLVFMSSWTRICFQKSHMGLNKEIVPLARPAQRPLFPCCGCFFCNPSVTSFFQFYEWHREMSVPYPRQGPVRLAWLFV